MTWFFFLLSLASVGFTYNVLHPVSRPPLLRVFGFFAGWLWGELAPWVLAIHVALVIGFGLGGAVTGGLGILGVVLMVGSCAVLLKTFLDSGRAVIIVDRALKDGLGGGFDESIRAEARSKFEHGVRWDDIARPFKSRHPDVECIKGILFGREKGTDLKLDILRHRSGPEKVPVLLQIHGGGWSVGYKESQGQPLMTRLASKGWVCVNIDYRLSPHATFPEHIIDCKRAIAWIKENVERYGGDPNFIVATGGSAGGHLSAMVGLTGNAPEYQPGFEKVDTRVQACVPFYGIYDMADRHGFHTGTDLPLFLEQHVLKGAYGEIPDLYHASSPLDRVNADAPPFFILHGDCDTLAPVDDARVFAEALRSRSKQPVLYAELPGAQHGFDIFHCLRSQAAVDAVERFAESVYTTYLESGTVMAGAVTDETVTQEAAPGVAVKKRSAAKTKASPKSKAPASARAVAKKKPAIESAAVKPRSSKSSTVMKPAGGKAKTLNGAAASGVDPDSRIAHLPASKAEAAKPKSRKGTATKKVSAATKSAGAKSSTPKRKSAAKPTAATASKRKPKKT